MYRTILHTCLRITLQSSAALLIGFSLATNVMATDSINKAPELDPGSMSSALTLLAGGALMVTDRFVRRNAKLAA